MASLIFDEEVAVDIPPAVAFHSFCNLNNAYASAEHPTIRGAGLVEGDGGVGSVIRYDFADVGTVKVQVEFLDKEAFEVTNNVKEGLGVGTNFESVTYNVKVLPTEAGSIFKVHAEYLPLPAAADFKRDDFIDAARARTIQMFKGIEAVIKAVPPMTIDVELTVNTVPPLKMFDGVIKYYEITKKLHPERYNSVGLIQGDGNVGSILQLDVVDVGIIKERIELLNKEEFETKFSVIEGPGIGSNLASITWHFKVSPTPTGAGCICKAHAEYITLHGTDFGKEDLNIRKEKAVQMFKAVADYLTSHP